MGFTVKPQLTFKIDTFRRKINFPRIPLMQIHELPRGGHFIHGNVVNVPADVNSTVSTLPRSIKLNQKYPHQTETKVELQASLSISEC